MVCDPRHRVDSKLIIVDTDDEDLVVSGAGLVALPPGVPGAGLAAEAPAALESLARSSTTSPFSARGAGSTPLRVNLSDKEAKHLSAPSAT